MMRRANLAYALEDRYCVLEVSNVEYWDNKPYVRVMANTVDRTKTTGLTKRVFVCGSLGRWLTGDAARNGEKAPDACLGRHP